MTRFEGLMASRPIVKLLLVALAVPAGIAAQSDRLVSIRDLTPREHRTEAFVLAAPQVLRIVAVGAEPAPATRGRRDRDWWGPDEERDVWPAAAWILNARTREVVWDLRTARSERTDDGLHHFDDTLRLPAGVYEAHYASYPAAWQSRVGDGSLRSIIRGLAREDGERYGGPYVDDGTFREFELVIRGAGRVARPRDLDEARRAFTATAITRLAPAGPDSTEQFAFALDRSTDVAIVASGEVRRDDQLDYAWIINADTRQRVWTMTYGATEEAGGAHKNRLARVTQRLPAGRYVAYFVTDDSHHPGEWNAVPPLDPELWGLTLRVADAAARAAVRSFVYEPVPSGQTIVSLTGIGDDERRSEGFALKQPLEVRIYALGEGTGGDAMHDYAWIVDARTRRRIWTMTYRETEHAGGAEKNRLFDGTLRLEPGNYLVYYRSDGSHSAREWNAARPAEARYWGVSVFPASGRLNRALIGPLERGGGDGTVLAELARMGDHERGRATFTLDQETELRIYALGEGSGGELFDYAWIEIAGSGRVVWKMSYRGTEHAGGAEKNRVFDGTVRLPAGSYVLRYESDGSHSYDDWNADPPDDPEGWGVVIRRPSVPQP
jgi:hypothetical protein